MFYLAGRTYVFECETVASKSITQPCLHPSHKHRLLRLMGIQTDGQTPQGCKPGPPDLR